MTLTKEGGGGALVRSRLGGRVMNEGRGEGEHDGEALLSPLQDDEEYLEVSIGMEQGWRQGASFKCSHITSL